MCDLADGWFACLSLRSIRLRSATDLKASIEGTMQLLFEDYSSVKVASAPTMSRARRKIDLALMFLRRLEWEQLGIHNCSLQLSAFALRSQTHRYWVALFIDCLSFLLNFFS